MTCALLPQFVASQFAMSRQIIGECLVLIGRFTDGVEDPTR